MKVKNFDEYVAELSKGQNSFLRVDVRVPVNVFKKDLKAKLQKAAEKAGAALVGGIKPAGNNGGATAYKKLCLLMLQMHLLKETLKINETNPDKAFTLHEEMQKLQEKIDGIIQTSPGLGLMTSAENNSGTPDYEFTSVFDARMKSQAQDEVNGILNGLEKAQTSEKAEKKASGKAGAVVKEVTKFKKDFKEIKIKTDKSKKHEGGLLVSADKSPDKKIKFTGKKGGVVSVKCSDKKASIPQKYDATKKVGGAAAEHMKGAVKLYVDSKFADKYIKPNPIVKNAQGLGSRKISGTASSMKGTVAKKSGEKAMQEDVRKHPIKKSIEQESEAFNKSIAGSYNTLNKPTLLPKLKK